MARRRNNKNLTTNPGRNKFPLRQDLPGGGPTIPEQPEHPTFPDPTDTTDPPIGSVEDLLRLAGQTVSRGEPVLASIRSPGVATDDLLARLRDERPPVQLSPTDLARLGASARAAAPIDFGVTELTTPLALTLPPGGYDVEIALRLRAATAVLGALYDEGVMPHRIDDSARDILFDVAALRAAFTGVPAGDDIVLGEFRWDPSPSIVAAPSDDENAVLRLPFSFDVNRGDTPVARLVGVVQAGVEPQASVGDRLMSVGISVVNPQPADLDLFEIAAPSDLQARSADASRAFAANVAPTLLLGLGLELASANVTICPKFSLPIGSGVPIRVQQIDLRVRPDGHSGMLIIGVLIGVGTEPTPGTGDPDRLRPPSMPEVSDVWTKVHAALLDKAVRQSMKTGELQTVVDEVAEQLDYRVVVEGASVEFEPLVARIHVDVRGVNVCGSKDVRARVTQEIRLSVLDGRIVVERSNHIDKDNSDTFLCAIMALFELLLAALIPPAFVIRLVYYIGLFSDSGNGPAVSYVSGMIDPGIPLPGTEVLPRLEVQQAALSDTGVQSNGTLDLRRDDTNTFIYLQVLGQVGVMTPTTVPEATVEIIDQDAPVPTGDDAQAPSDTSTISQKRIVNTSHEVIAPRDDQILADGKTDIDGKLRLWLSPHEITTTAGTLITTRTTERLDFDRNDPGSLQRTETQRPLREPLPDVYFRITLPSGEVVDSRALDDAFLVNLHHQHIGTVEDPLRLIIRRQLPSHRGNVVIAHGKSTSPHAKRS